MTNFPFLTMVDPVTTGEGALDPLGLSTIGDRLADQVLPGLRARMSRPRFLTAIAVSAAICEGLEDRIASDRVTPAYLVFEWLLAEGFVRAGDRESTRGTPGTLKAQAVKAGGEVMCAKTYLRIPSVFGFHGVYKPLARHLGIVDEDLRLNDNGYALLKVWQDEQELQGFLESSVTEGRGTSARSMLRSAVEEGLRQGYTKRGGNWPGWPLLADHLAPGKIGSAEAAFINRLLLDAGGGTRGEIFRLLQSSKLSGFPESGIIRRILFPKASPELTDRLRAISEFENVGMLLEDAFDWIRYLSSTAGAQTITAARYSKQQGIRHIASGLRNAFRRAEEALAGSPLSIQNEFADLNRSFDRVSEPSDLFEAVLSRHHDVQQAKKPEGKRDWFERASDGGAFVRVPYRLIEPVKPRDSWSRPYRVDAARSFCADLLRGDI